MTAVSVESWSGLTAWEDVADELAAITRDYAGSSVLETRSGAVLLYATGPDASAAVIDAVLRRSSAPLHAAATDRRTASVLPSGPVTSLLVEGRHALLVPLAVGGELFGWWWLIGAPPSDSDKRLTWHTASLESAIALASTQAGPCAATKALSGVGPLPAGMDGQDVYLCHVTGTGPGVGQALRRSVAVRSGAHVAVAVRDPFTVQVLVAGAEETVVERLRAWIGDAERILGHPLCAAVVGPTRDVAALPLLAEQAELVVASSDRPGECLAVPESRRVLVDHHLYASVQALPRVGEDPLGPLLRHDALKGTTFASTLLCWLDTHGDTPLTASRLHLHTNTLRYRLKRAGELLQHALKDPAARLEIHLRLRQLSTEGGLRLSKDDRAEP